MITKDKKISEKDFIILGFIVLGLVMTYFVYANFVPKDFDNSIKVNVIEITADCEECLDVDTIVAALIEKGIVVKDKKVFNYKSAEGKNLIDKYGIEKVPALIVLSKRINEFDNEDFFEDNGQYGIFDKAVPYIDLRNDELKGVVNFLEIQADCEECLSLSLVKNQFEKLGVKVGDYEIILEETSIGQEIVKQNNLTFAPAILISDDIEEYWWVFPQVKDSFVKNGKYYLLNAAVPPYRDLITREKKGIVDITYLENESCEECSDIKQLKKSFQAIGIYIDSEKTVNASSNEGKKLISRYNITAIPTVILTKGLLDYNNIEEMLGKVGTFDPEDNNFIFRNVKILGLESQEVVE